MDLAGRLRQADEAMRGDRLEQAEGLYRELTVLYPYRVAPYQGLASVFAAQGRRDEAVSLLLELSRELIKIAREQAALSPLEQAIRLDPECLDAHALAGRILAGQHRYHDAVASLERAAELGASDLETLLALASSYKETERYMSAERTYRRALELHGDNVETLSQLERFLRWLGRSAEEAETLAADGSVVLTPVARSAGLDFRHDPGTTRERHLPETMGSGLAWLDYDGDGWQDLYLVQSSGASRLFRNRGGTFEDVTERSAAGDRSYGQGATAADVDGDGRVDLYLTNYGPDVLLRNRGDGTFAVTTGVGADGWSSSSALADADGDGDLDLYVTRYVDYDPGHGAFCGDQATGEPDYCNVIFFPGADDVFYLQKDDGTFEETVLEGTGGRGLGAVWSDLDGDRRPDLYVANDLDPNRLLQNLSANGTLAFEDVSLLSGAAINREGKAEAGMGVAVGDVDGDGRPEIAVTNFDVETSTLYRNLGGLQFQDASATSGFGLPSFNLLGFGLVLADFDGDGDLDAYAANGHVFERPGRDTVERAQRDLLLLGDGRGNFREQPLSGEARIGRGAASADFDNDGDPDVAVQHSGAAPELWRNDSAAGSWLGVELRGRPRNTQVIGARVTLTTGGRRQVRWVTAGGSYQSSNDRRLLFGWPSGEEVRELEVVWPSGRVTRLRHPPRLRYIRLIEPRRPRRPDSIENELRDGRDGQIQMKTGSATAAMAKIK